SPIFENECAQIMDQQDLIILNKRLEDELEVTKNEIDRLKKENAEVKEQRIQQADSHNVQLNELLGKHQTEIQAMKDEIISVERKYQELLKSQRNAHTISMMTTYRIIASIPTSIECDKESTNLEREKSKLRIAISEISDSLDTLYDVILKDGNPGITKLKQMDQAKKSAGTCEKALSICTDMIAAIESSLNIDSLLRRLVKTAVISVKQSTSALQTHITRLRGILYGSPKVIDVGELEAIRTSLRELQKEMDVIPVIQGPTTAEKLEPQMLTLTRIDAENFLSLENDCNSNLAIGALEITEESEES
ncbi:hypothetical protein PFISCL1PPCAC_7345, partial [Pristionchus fissidentatus]